MYRLTERRKSQAREVLDRYTRMLHGAREFEPLQLERELCDLWGVGYRSLKGIMIDMVSNHPEYAHLAAYYMEHSNAPGVVSEFQATLASLYGLTWYHDAAREAKRAEYWERAFAVISQFDLDVVRNGTTFLQVSRLVKDRLVEEFLRSPDKLYSVEAREFEALIADVLDGLGYEVELTQRTRDGGRDIIAIGNRSIASSKYLIECKRYSAKRTVGIAPVRSLYGVVADEGATKGIIVTTSSFTKPAHEFLDRHTWRLEGRAFDGVLEWLREYQRQRLSVRQ
jgi:hypothetical protein